MSMIPQLTLQRCCENESVKNLNDQTLCLYYVTGSVLSPADISHDLFNLPDTPVYLWFRECQPQS